MKVRRMLGTQAVKTINLGEGTKEYLDNGIQTINGYTRTPSYARYAIDRDSRSCPSLSRRCLAVYVGNAHAQNSINHLLRPFPVRTKTFLNLPHPSFLQFV